MSRERAVRAERPLIGLPPPSEPVSSAAPTFASRSEIQTERSSAGGSLALLCLAQGYPLPNFR